MHDAIHPIAIYSGPQGLVDVRVQGDTVWLSQEQMTQLFGRERSVITKHIRNVFADGELDEESNVQNLHIAGSDKPSSVEEPKLKALFRNAKKGERSRPRSVRADSAHTAEAGDPDEVEHEFLWSISPIRRGNSVLAACAECRR